MRSARSRRPAERRATRFRHRVTDRSLLTSPPSRGARRRILFLAHSFPRHPGDAAGSFLLRLAVALRDAEVDVRVLAPSAPGLPPTDAIEGIPVTRYRYAPAPLETLAYTGNMAADVAASLGGKLALAGLLASGMRCALGEARRWRPNVVHAHWWFPGGLVGLGACGVTGVPLMTTLHGSDVRLAVGAGAAHPAFRRVLRGSSVVTAVSSWLAREARRLAPSAAIEVAPMPVRDDIFTPDPAARAADARFLFVGRLNEQKGVVHLLDALARMRHRATLDVVGDGPDRDALLAQSARRGLVDRVQWHRAVPHDALPGLYRQSTALVLPSRDEGLGLVAVEAHLCGTPVIGADSGGIPDVVRHRETGLLAPVGDAGALAQAMDALLDRDDRGLAWGEAGRRAAVATFAPAAVARRYVQLYATAVERQGGRPQ